MVAKEIMAVLWVALFFIAFAFAWYVPSWSNSYWDFTTAPANTVMFMQLGFVIVMFFALAVIITTFVE
jgi:hypothetical protein